METFTAKHLAERVGNIKKRNIIPETEFNLIQPEINTQPEDSKLSERTQQSDDNNQITDITIDELMHDPLEPIDDVTQRQEKSRHQGQN